LLDKGLQIPAVPPSYALVELSAKKTLAFNLPRQFKGAAEGLRNFARTVLNPLLQDRLNRRILTPVHSFVFMVVLQLHGILE